MKATYNGIDFEVNSKEDLKLLLEAGTIDVSKTAFIKIQCKGCGHSWNYGGLKIANNKNKIYISCPSCRTTVTLKKVDGLWT